LMVAAVATKLAAKQIAAPRGKPRALFLLAVDDIRRRGCAGAGVRLKGAGLSDICRLYLYGAWRLLTVFETKTGASCCWSPSTPARRIRTNSSTTRWTSANLSSPRTKPTCCDAEGQPPVEC
jgi:hypothetical protein